MNAAKRAAFLLACLLAVSAPAGCEKKSACPTDNVYHAETDCQFSWYSSMGTRIFAETPEGYYALLHQCVLHYIDKKTMEPIPVCAKPNCLHDDQSCDAYFNGIDCSVDYVDGRLYVTAQGKAGTEDTQNTLVMEVSPDGSQRKTLISYPSSPQGYKRRVIHRGHFYRACADYDENMEIRSGIWQYDLANPAAKPKLLCEMEVSANDPDALYADNLTAYGHYLYVYVKRGMARLDINNPKKGLEWVCDIHEVPASGIPNAVDNEAIFYPCFSDRYLFFETSYRYLDEMDKLACAAVWKCGAEPLSAPERLLNDLAQSAMGSDGTYIYRLDFDSAGYKEMHEDKTDPLYGQALKIYDSDGKLLENIDISHTEHRGPVLFVAPGDHVIFGDSRFNLWYIDKSEIGSGNVQVHMLTDFGYQY